MSTPPPSDIPSRDPADSSFLIATLACGVPAIVGLYWYFTPQAGEAHPIVRVAVLVVAGVAYMAAAWLYTWPSRARALARPLIDLPTALLEVKGQLTDLNAIKKEYNRYQSQLEGLVGQFSQVLKAMNDELARRLADLDARQKAFDQMAADRRETERKVSEMRQELTRAAADVKRWEDSVIQFAQLLERTSDPTGGLSLEYQRAAARMTSYFAKAFGPFGLQLVSPAEGDFFDARTHQVEATEPHATVVPGRVVRCTEWGFILRDEVRKAKVVVAVRPPASVSPVATGPTSTEPIDSFSPIPVSTNDQDANNRSQP